LTFSHSTVHSHKPYAQINWRLESRKSFALNKMVTRNNEIDRRKKNGIAYDDLIPTGLRVSVPSIPPSTHL
jgi:hypothetical protein